MNWDLTRCAEKIEKLKLEFDELREDVIEDIKSLRDLMKMKSLQEKVERLEEFNKAQEEINQQMLGSYHVHLGRIEVLENKADNLEFGVRQNCKEVERLDESRDLTNGIVQQIESRLAATEKAFDFHVSRQNRTLDDVFERIERLERQWAAQDKRGFLHGVRLSKLESPKPQDMVDGLGTRLRSAESNIAKHEEDIGNAWVRLNKYPLHKLREDIEHLRKRDKDGTHQRIEIREWILALENRADALENETETRWQNYDNRLARLERILCLTCGHFLPKEISAQEEDKGEIVRRAREIVTGVWSCRRLVRPEEGQKVLEALQIAAEKESE